MNKITIEEYLQQHKEILIAPHGDSMRPLFIEDCCEVLLRRPNGFLRKYDIVLYPSGMEDYILHRIISLRNGRMTICGDNTYQMERGIKQEEIIGVMEGFYRKGRFYTEKSISYRIYVWLWWHSFTIRKICCQLWKLLKKFSVS